MPKLGTWTTIDCPIENQKDALVFLGSEFEKIGGEVRKVLNPHEIITYPSYEVDSPNYVENYDEDDATDEENKKYREWVNKANEIEKAYNKKFEQWL